MKDRIETIIKRSGLSPSKFADKLGVQRSGISHILSGRNNPSLDFLEKVLINFPDISGDWLIIGKGNMLKSKESAPLPTQLSIDAPPVVTSTLKDEDKVEYRVTTKQSEVETKPIPTIQKVPNIPLADGDKEIDHIVVFYKDRTFRAYKPD